MCLELVHGVVTVYVMQCFEPPSLSCHCPCWGKNGQEFEESAEEGRGQGRARAAGDQRRKTRWSYKSKWPDVCISFRNKTLPAGVESLTTDSGLQDKMDLSCVHNPAVAELMRCIRSQIEALVTGLPPREISAMSLGLAHRSVPPYNDMWTQLLPVITLAVWTNHVDSYQHSSLPLRHLASLWFRTVKCQHVN